MSHCGANNLAANLESAEGTGIVLTEKIGHCQVDYEPVRDVPHMAPGQDDYQHQQVAKKGQQKDRHVQADEHDCLGVFVSVEVGIHVFVEISGVHLRRLEGTAVEGQMQPRCRGWDEERVRGVIVAQKFGKCPVDQEVLELATNFLHSTAAVDHQTPLSVRSLPSRFCITHSPHSLSLSLSLSLSHSVTVHRLGRGLINTVAAAWLAWPWPGETRPCTNGPQAYGAVPAIFSVRC